MSDEHDTLASYEQDCGLLRVQALGHGAAMMDRVDAALSVAARHIDRIHAGHLSLSPAVASEIKKSIADARGLLGVGR